MPEIEVKIGGRSFEVSCQEGEEHFLQSAARLLDNEASVLTAQIGHIPESRMLLMAGLMLADKTAGLEEKLRASEASAGTQGAELEQLRNAPAAAAAAPEKIEVAVIPPMVTEALNDIAARTEALADKVEAKVNAG